MSARALDAAAAPRQIDGFTLGELVHSSAMASIFRVAAGPAAAPLAFPAMIKVPRLAAGEGGPIGMSHVMRAARREYTKIDKPVVESDFRPRPGAAA